MKFCTCACESCFSRCEREHVDAFDTARGAGASRRVVGAKSKAPRLPEPLRLCPHPCRLPPRHPFVSTFVSADPVCTSLPPRRVSQKSSSSEAPSRIPAESENSRSGVTRTVSLLPPRVRLLALCAAQRQRVANPPLSLLLAPPAFAALLSPGREPRRVGA